MNKFLQSVSVSAKANVYFDGKVVSHSITLSDGSQKTLGLIYPGSYHFNTAKAERMEIIAGSCSVTFDQSGNTTPYNENQAFEVSLPTVGSAFRSAKESANTFAPSSKDEPIELTLKTTPIPL